MGQCPDKQTLPPPATAPAAQDASGARSALALVAVISMLSGMLSFSALQAASAREQVYLAWAFGVFAIGTFATLIGQVIFLEHSFRGAEARAYSDGYRGAVALAPGTGCIVVGWVLVGLSLHAHLDAGGQPWALVAGVVMQTIYAGICVYWVIPVRGNEASQVGLRAATESTASLSRTM